LACPHSAPVASSQAADTVAEQLGSEQKDDDHHDDLTVGSHELLDDRERTCGMLAGHKVIRTHLGSTRRAGTRALRDGTPAGEDAVMVKAGFTGPRRVTVPGRIHERSEDQIVASVFSLSWAAPHLFAERLRDFETELRELLRRASPSGRFSERARDVELVIWTR
jgi:hypothetical protein